ncbi:hypothetical protein PQC13_gp002 [Synechococcus phage S-SRM01]|uniref:Uncharacterized protein n=1 Tax=Synechococcus phage S-SRM01 TaxID=2781608 RepID=A0A879R2U6_9CAUD|nr:hypothetical protein PQC13_gp002 [Synechococcus phage S-SRM01]QPX47967.1 hypothetical protein [Synechococcus phage S-SRM01]
MTIITPTGITGITSITSTGNTLQFTSASGGNLDVNGLSVTSGSNINVSGIVTASGFVGNITGNINSTGVSTVTTLRSTSIVGVSSIGVTTSYVTSINDGPISGARNRIINGAMEIAQRGISATYAGTSQNQSTYNTIDRFAFASYGSYPAGTYATVAQIADAPVGFSSCLRVTANQTLTVGSSNARGVWVTQAIEGYNFVDLWNKPITVSFWVKTSNVGTYSLAFSGTGSTAGYATSYTVNSANTWEYKSVTLTHSTSLYTPDRSNGVALTLVFGLLGDATWIGTATANQWVSANVPYLHGCKNLFDTLNATWQITGVQLEAGTVATPFERRSYGQELALCYRYYRKYSSSGSTYTSFGSGLTGGSSSINRWGFSLDIPMRTTPTVAFTNCVGWNGPIGGAISVAGSYTTNNNIDLDLNTSGLNTTVGFIAKVLLLSNGYAELTGAEL